MGYCTLADSAGTEIKSLIFQVLDSFKCLFCFSGFKELLLPLQLLIFAFMNLNVDLFYCAIEYHLFLLLLI